MKKFEDWINGLPRWKYALLIAAGALAWLALLNWLVPHMP